MPYDIISIVEYQSIPGVEAPKEQLFKVTFWHPDKVFQGIMITGAINDEKELQQRIEEFVNNPLGARKPGPSETKADAASKT